MGFSDKAREIVDKFHPENNGEYGDILGWKYYYFKGEYDKALKSLAEENRIEGMWASYPKCLILAKMGKKDEVREIIQRIHDKEEEIWDPRPLLEIYAALGDRDSMYYWLQHPINIGFGTGHNGNPIFDPYRKEPPYREWLRQTYLPQPEDTLVPE